MGVATEEFACNGAIIEDEDLGKGSSSASLSALSCARRKLTSSFWRRAVIQLQGDQRTKIQEMLIEEGIEKETIKCVPRRSPTSPSPSPACFRNCEKMIADGKAVHRMHGF